MDNRTRCAPQIGVVILGGGEATRLPGKLALDAGSVPMIARVYRNVSRSRETFVSCKATFPDELDALLPCPMVVDRWSMRGPLAGMISAMSQMTAPFVFAVAGDAPFIDAAFIDQLAGQLEPGDEAIVPVHGENGRRQLEPLAAIYGRFAFLREAIPVLREGNGALRIVIERLRARYVSVTDERIFANVNTPDDYERLRTQLAAPRS